MSYRNDGRPGGPLPAPGPDTPSWALALIERMDRFLQVAEEDRRRAEERDRRAEERDRRAEDDRRRAEEDRHRSNRQIDQIIVLFTRTYSRHRESLVLQRENNLLLRELLKAVRGWGNGRANSGGNSQPRNRH